MHLEKVITYNIDNIRRTHGYNYGRQGEASVNL